jgi:hypothetical protein
VREVPDEADLTINSQFPEVRVGTLTELVDWLPPHPKIVIIADAINKIANRCFKLAPPIPSIAAKSTLA